MSWYPPYVSVAEKRAKAERKLKSLKKKNPGLKPVVIEGRTLAQTWWGKSWNNNLERYADFSNRIGRGRSYVRHRAVLDLQIKSGKVTVLVLGSARKPYKIEINIKPVKLAKWAVLRRDCQGQLKSLQDLLEGKFPKALAKIFFSEDSGLFPAPEDITFDCSCPDWAEMCKHVAAALYGIGARFDEDPRLFFKLRGVKIDDLITLDPAEIFEFAGAEYAANTYDRLINYDVEDVSRIYGGIAESWKISDDGMTYLFKIRKGVTFASGNKLTADDVVFSLQRVIILDKSPAFIL